MHACRSTLEDPTALLERERTGRGRHVDVALYDAAVHANLVGWAVEAGGRRGVGDRLPLTGALPCYNLYETADGRRLAMGALEPHFWKRFCDAVDRPDLVKRQLSASAVARRKVAELIRSRTLAAWMELLGRQDIPVEPLLSASEARNHPQLRERALLSAGPERLPRLGFPALLDGERPQAGGKVPGLGEQTKALLAELGLTEKAGRSAGVGPRFHWKRWLLKWFA